ncbi:hypothetical protein ASG14_11800 [Pedobacter sp. Leaf194]|nr:hypothetical protein ASG14_11800 [Pedobacter sp. Leaf194]
MLSLHSPAFAVDGCLLPNNIVYRSATLFNHLGLETFQRGGLQTALSANNCSWTPKTGSACYVCATITGLACSDMASVGIRSTNFQMVQCNLDNYTFALSAAAGLCGMLIIRKQHRKK